MTEFGERLHRVLRLVGRTACLLLVGAGLCAADPAQFILADPGAEAQQSRIFEDTSFDELAASCLSVIQDIQFAVTETEFDPGLIVAKTPALVIPRSSPSDGRYTPTNYASPHELLPAYTLTISFRAVGISGKDQQLRVALDHAGSQVDSDFKPFYQNFFTHLSRTQNRGRMRP
jgi:hypothetical protein